MHGGQEIPLGGVGRRFSKIYLLESILQPSRNIAPSYRTLNLRLSDGRILTGVQVAETVDTLTIGDTNGKTHVVRKADIEQRKTSSSSIMPEGLEKRLTRRQLADLIAFLLSQKDPNVR